MENNTGWYRAKQIRYCQRFQGFVRSLQGILDITRFTDEAWFHSSAHVSSQSYRIWAAENPFEIHEERLHPEKLGFWCAVSGTKIICWKELRTPPRICTFSHSLWNSWAMWNSLKATSSKMAQHATRQGNPRQWSGIPPRMERFQRICGHHGRPT